MEKILLIIAVLLTAVGAGLHKRKQVVKYVEIFCNKFPALKFLCVAVDVIHMRLDYPHCPLYLRINDGKDIVDNCSVVDGCRSRGKRRQFGAFKKTSRSFFAVLELCK